MCRSRRRRRQSPGRGRRRTVGGCTLSLTSGGGLFSVPGLGSHTRSCSSARTIPARDRSSRRLRGAPAAPSQPVPRAPSRPVAYTPWPVASPRAADSICAAHLGSWTSREADDSLVVTVCDHADEELAGLNTHWSVPDPAASGDIDRFEAAFDQISDRIDHLSAIEESS